MLRAQTFSYEAAIAVPFHLVGRARDAWLRLTVDALSRERSMVDASRDMRLFQCRIGSDRPAFAHVKQFADAGSHPCLAAACVVPFECGFRAESRQRNFAGRCQQMSVKIARIAAGIVAGRVNRDIERESV